VQGRSPALHALLAGEEALMWIAGRWIEGIGLGTAQFAFREVTAQDSVATVRAALDAGVQLIDTALAYTRPGVESYAEQVVASALRDRNGDRPMVVTKGGHWRAGDQFRVDGRPETLRAHCEISLRTLGVERIDLYFLHHVDSAVALAESVDALEQLRREGKIAAIGLSNVTIAQLDAALATAPIAAVQNRLSLGERADLPMARACAQRGSAYLAYSPFGGPSGTLPAAAHAVARRHGVSVQRVALAWLRGQSRNILPLVGASRPSSILDSVAPLDLAEQDLLNIEGV
jgi:aryl-alcohol dehydrogenase-like predicted oxidoreductase